MLCIITHPQGRRVGLLLPKTDALLPFYFLIRILAMRETRYNPVRSANFLMTRATHSDLALFLTPKVPIGLFRPGKYLLLCFAIWLLRVCAYFPN